MKKLIFLFVLLIIGSFFIYNSNSEKKEVIKKSILVEPTISKDSLLNLGMSERITNQYIEIRNTKKNQDKSFYIVDTKENLIFLFDKTGKFIAKSPTIDGFDKQNSEYEKDALKSWIETSFDAGFEYNFMTREYIDRTSQNRKYSHSLVFSYLKTTKYKFFPKGIYIIKNKYYDDWFVGNIDNVYDIYTLDGKKIALSIHGLYKSEYRIKNMNYQVSLIGEDFTKINVPKKYIKEILDNDSNSNYNNSFGCINVPEKFLDLTNSYSVNSLVFVIGENDDYLIK